MMQTNNIFGKNFSFYYWGGLLLGLLLSFIYAGNQIITGDQAQMLDKGYLGASTGVWLGYGNVASVVGNVPGSLSALIVGLPLVLWDDPWAPMLLLIFLHLISFFLFDSVIKRVYGSSIRILFIVIYWLNPWFLFENIIYNPSYLFIFSALHFWTAFQMREKKSFIYSLLHVASIGMALQLHYSWVILPAISLYLYYKNIIKVDWSGLISGGLLVLASLVPYALSVLDNPAITKNATETDRYIGWGGLHVYPILKAFVYWLRFASTMFTIKLLGAVNFEWVTTVVWLQTTLLYLWKALVYAIALATVWLAFKANQFVWYKVKGRLLRTKEQETLPGEAWIFFYLIGTLIAIFISAVASPIVFSYWHLMIVFPFALFPLLAKINHTMETKSFAFKKYLLVVALYFTIINIFAAIESEKFSYKVSYTQQTFEQIASKYSK